MNNDKEIDSLINCYSDLDSKECHKDNDKESITFEIREAFEQETKEDKVRRDIDYLIKNGTELDLAKLYDLILNNLSVASENDIRVLLIVMKRPKESDSAEIIRSLTMHCNGQVFL